MAKKAAENSSRTLSGELAGLGLCALSLFFLLSLLSLKGGFVTENWLGLVGYTSAWILQFLFGLGSYFLIGAIFWWGLRLMMGKRPAHPKVKVGCLTLLLFSLCLLLNLLATSFPAVGAFASSLISQAGGRYHLGGIPFTYLYLDLPHANLHRLLSTVGTTFLCIGMGLTSLLVMADVGITALVEALAERLKREVGIEIG